MAEQHEKPRMEKGSIKISASGVIEATLLRDFSKFSSGGMLMKIADTDLKLMDGDKEVGSMGVSIGGGLYVQIDDREWTIDPLQIFEMVRQAEKEQYLK